MEVFQSEDISSSTTMKMLCFFLITMSTDCQTFLCHFINRGGPQRFNLNWYPNFHMLSFCQLIYEFLPSIWLAFVEFTIFGKNLPFSKNQLCQGSLFCHLIWILIKPFMYSSQICHFCQNLLSSLKSLITNWPFSAIVIWQAIHFLLPKSLFSPNLSIL